MTTKTKLTVIDGETLMDMKLPPTKFCVETLLPQGIFSRKTRENPLIFAIGNGIIILYHPKWEYNERLENAHGKTEKNGRCHHRNG